MKNYHRLNECSVDRAAAAYDPGCDEPTGAELHDAFCAIIDDIRPHSASSRLYRAVVGADEPSASESHALILRLRDAVYERALANREEA
jgi:hypothetical protein